MANSPMLPADAVAERIVRHFQLQGFAGISEALILRIRLIKGGRHEIEAAFETAIENHRTLPLHEQFEVRAIGHFAEARDFNQARAAIQSDFGVALRREMPSIYFDPAPVMIDDPMASGTKYDAMVKLWDNLQDCAYAVLLNDPDASFLDYVGSHHGDDWEKIMGGFGETAMSFGSGVELA